MADAIFISYRRDDSEGEAGRLFDDLIRAFGNDAVFMDVAGIRPGVDFRKAIEDNVTSCGVFLAIIGPAWLTIASPEGKRRLDDPSDFVALEIASALRREVPVIPILVHDAKMPAVDLLPEALKPLAYRNSVELSHARWNSDVTLLIEALKSYVTPRTSSETPVHATVPVQLPAPHPPEGTLTPAAAKSKTPLLAGVAVAAVVIVAVAVFFATRPSPAPTPNPGPSPALASTPAVSADPAAGLVGTWKRAGGAGNGDALGELIISGTGSSLTVHAFGGCQAANCDWGTQPGAFDGTNLVATFSPSPSGSDTSRTATVTAHTVPGGLDVLIQNTFQGPGGTRSNSAHPTFIAAQ